METALALYSILVALIVLVRFVHVKSQLQVILRRAPMTTGSFWFSGSFKLTESIQRQEFVILAYVATALAMVGGVFSVVSLTVQRDTTSAFAVLIGLSLAGVFYCLRVITRGVTSRRVTTWVLLSVHSIALALAVLSISR